MGCKSCRPSSNPYDDTLSNITDHIEQNNPSNLENLIKILSHQQKIEIPLIVNKPLINIDKFYCNFLCYSFWLGKGEVFSHLLNIVQCSLSEMEEIFLKAKHYPMMILCEKGHINVLKVYLPEYLKKLNSKKEIIKDKSVSVGFSINSIANQGHSTFTIIQVACIKDHIRILHFVNDFFSNSAPPTELDIHHKNEMTGENCALLAVRAGNYGMIKYLHKSANADFHIKNNYNEGALQILAVSSKLNYSSMYIECMKYLVEVIKIDIIYMHEETLQLLESENLINYLEEKLKCLGIIASKSEFESIYRFKSYTGIKKAKESISILESIEDVSEAIPNSIKSSLDASKSLFALLLE